MATREYSWSGGGYGAIAQIFRWAAVNQQAIRPADLALYQDAAAHRGALSGMLNYYRAGLQSLWSREWGVLHVPTLMLWGRQDPTLGIELTYGTEAFVRELKIQYLDYCGHFVQQEQPDLVNEYLLEWLETVSAPPKLDGVIQSLGQRSPAAIPAFQALSA